VVALGQQAASNEPSRNAQAARALFFYIYRENLHGFYLPARSIRPMMLDEREEAEPAL